MRRGQEHGRAGESAAVAAPGRRAFLGAGIGCALPLVAGTGFVRAGGFLQAGAGGADSDPVWEHIAAECWRTCQEIQGPLGPRGEHVRRLASQVDLFAAHLRGCGLDRHVDDEVRRIVRERGRDAAAFEIVDHHRATIGHSRRVPRRGPDPDIDPAKVAACLDAVLVQGTARVWRSRRAALDAAAARLDGELATAAGRVRPVSLVGQKPGDDFPGLPDPQSTPEVLCNMFQDIVVGCTVLMVVLTFAGQLEALPAIQALQAAAEVLALGFCRARNE
jgi:hypothetical protein